jgi:hypothetical protein
VVVTRTIRTGRGKPNRTLILRRGTRRTLLALCGEPSHITSAARERARRAVRGLQMWLLARLEDLGMNLKFF